MPCLCVHLETLADFKAIQSRNHDVQQDEIGKISCNDINGIDSSHCSMGQVASGRQKNTFQLQQGFIVFNNENFFGIGINSMWQQYLKEPAKRTKLLF